MQFNSVSFQKLQFLIFDLNIIIFFYFFFVVQLHEDAPTEEHLGNFCLEYAGVRRECNNCYGAQNLTI